MPTAVAVIRLRYAALAVIKTYFKANSNQSRRDWGTLADDGRRSPVSVTETSFRQRGGKPPKVSAFSVTPEISEVSAAPDISGVSAAPEISAVSAVSVAPEISMGSAVSVAPEIYAAPVWPLRFLWPLRSLWSRLRSPWSLRFLRSLRSLCLCGIHVICIYNRFSCYSDSQ